MVQPPPITLYKILVLEFPLVKANYKNYFSTRPSLVERFNLLYFS